MGLMPDGGREVPVDYFVEVAVVEAYCSADCSGSGENLDVSAFLYFYSIESEVAALSVVGDTGLSIFYLTE